MLLAVVGWFFLCFILFVCLTDTLYNALLPGLSCVYILITPVLIGRNAIHRIKWYVLTHPSKVQCTQCHTTVPLSRYKEEHYLNSPISLCLPKISDLRFTPYRVLFYEIAYRPYLQLDCSECGEKQVICPYCHKPIQEESVICKYDKPSICSYCGKKIYTPVPMREWEEGMYIGDILN